MSASNVTVVPAQPPLPILFVDGSRQFAAAPCQLPLSVVAVGLPGNSCELSDADGAVLATGKFTIQGLFEVAVPPPPPCPNFTSLRLKDTTNGSVSNPVIVFTYLLGQPVL